MANAATLVVGIVAETRQFQADMKKSSAIVAQEATAMSQSIDGIRGGFDLASRAAGAFGLALGVKELVEFTARTIGAGAAIKHLADQVGLTTDEYQSFRFAATQVGVSQEEADTAIARLTRTIGEAADGNQKAAGAFEKLGIGIRDVNGEIRPTGEILRDVADAIERLPTPAERARVEVELFGRSGQKLGPLLDEGSAGIDQMIAKSKELGVVLSTETIDKLEKAKQKVDEFTLRWHVYTEELAAGVTPALIKVLDLLESIQEDNKPQPVTIFDRRQLDNAVDNLHAIDDEIARLASQKDPMEGSPFFDPTRIGRTTEALKEQRAALAALVETLSQKMTGGNELGRYAGAGDTYKPPSRPLITVPDPDGLGAGGAGGSKADATQRVIDQLRFEQEQLSRTAAEQKLYNDLRAAGTTLDTKAGQQIQALDNQMDRQKDLAKEIADDDAKHNELLTEAARIHEEVLTPLQKYNEELARADELQKAGALSLADYNAYVLKLDADLKQATETSSRLAKKQDDLGNSNRDVAQSFIDGAANAKTWQDVLTEAIKAVAQEIENLLGVSKNGSTAGSDFSNILTEILGVFAGSSAGIGTTGPMAGLGGQGALAGFADGGRPPVGRPSWVGERGRELFVPDSSGTIIPSDLSSALASRPANDGGPAPTIVNLNVYPKDYDSFRKSSSQTLRDGLRAAARANQRIGG